MSKYVKTPTILQMEATECGAASLAMVLAYFGCNIPLEQLRIDTGVSRNGVNGKNIYYAAQRYGLEVHGYSKNTEGLLKLDTPCIIHWNFNHFVVFEGVKGKHFIINDPAQGRRKITKSEFSMSFTGVCMTFAKGPDFKAVEKQRSGREMAIKRLSNEKSSIAAMLLTGMLLIVPGILIPSFSKVFIDKVLIAKMDDWMLTLLIAMFLTLLFDVLFRILRSNMMIKLQTKLSLISSYNFLGRVFKLPVAFFEQRYAGDISERIKNNNEVNIFLTGDLGQAIMDVAIAVFYLIMMFMYSSALTLIGIVFIAITVAYTFFASKATETASKKTQQNMGKLVGALYAGFSIRDTLKASGAESGYVSRIMGLDANVFDAQQPLMRTTRILQAVPQAIMHIAEVVILMMGGISVIRGYMTPGTLVAFTQLLTSIAAPVMAVCALFSRIQTLKADMARVEDVEKYPLPERDTEIVDINKKLDGNVEIKNISFGYSVLEAPVITDFSLSIPSGSSVALVGSSGCGKSTVAKIVSGLNDPWAGEVLIDDIPMHSIPRNIFNQSVSTVSQDINLFTGSIKENLTLWSHNVMEKSIISAAKDACIHDFITSLPGAYDFRISESGKNISGGQRQRLEIARALVTEPSLLIMDEATSALDPLVEKKVMDNIRRRGCSLLVVAHRLSTIRDCDEIIVIHDGKIAERGTHEQLIDLNGIYKGLIENA